ncbi:hypothetical protein ALO61_101659 [Pseudomonas savastanoi pv. nerii]|nr:hypothetical protein ALO61_101659 [Pseudomonas savastanoi pv. nerii]KPY40678.1 putative HNH nuclease [Pseudomonas savastanoi pv. retacarpa]KUG45241.1 hypothetical protein ALP79_101709 [Pseudomonas savastanoi pv. fraxini]RMN71170.1 hypothetical protein ALQ55_101701 [Pseudomonas savastanoi pv. savastanoi]RML17866.1 putative HNH nuclease [Pseudomonas savastanoi pv. retacarpa]
MRIEAKAVLGFKIEEVFLLVSGHSSSSPGWRESLRWCIYDASLWSRPMTDKKKVNKHGLSRKISAAVRRAVRINSGFGCVICGTGIVQYEHVDPEFKDAEEHDAAFITLLCPGCHGRVTTGMYSKEKVKRAMKSPAALKEGFSRDCFDFCGDHPFITIGGATLRTCRIPLRIFGTDILRIDPPEVEGETFLLSGTFFDTNGRPTLVIDKNEWRASVDSWDVVTEGRSIVIRNGPGNIVLKLVAEPPSGLIIERLNMTYGCVQISASATELVIGGPLGGGTFANCFTDGLHVGFELFPLQNTISGIHPQFHAVAKMVRSQVLYGDNWLPRYMSTLG